MIYWGKQVGWAIARKDSEVGQSIYNSKDAAISKATDLINEELTESGKVSEYMLLKFVGRIIPEHSLEISTIILPEEPPKPNE